MLRSQSISLSVRRTSGAGSLACVWPRTGGPQKKTVNTSAKTQRYGLMETRIRLGAVITRI